VIIGSHERTGSQESNRRSGDSRIIPQKVSSGDIILRLFRDNRVLVIREERSVPVGGLTKTEIKVRVIVSWLIW